MKKAHFKAFFIVMAWVFALNLIYEFLIIFMVYNPFSRIGAIGDMIRTWGRRNYTNTASVLPDEMVGTWVVENSPKGKTKLILLEDQTFELHHWMSAYYIRGLPPNIPSKYRNPDDYEGKLLILRGNWGMATGSVGSTIYSTSVLGKYEGEDEYVDIGEVLDRHATSPDARLALKWEREERELGPDPGVYLEKLKKHE